MSPYLLLAAQYSEQGCWTIDGMHDILQAALSPFPLLLLLLLLVLGCTCTRNSIKQPSQARRLAHRRLDIVLYYVLQISVLRGVCDVAPDIREWVRRR
jgi:hypothetical protein